MKSFLIVTILLVLNQQIQSTPYYYRVGRNVVAIESPDSEIPDDGIVKEILKDAIVSELRKDVNNQQPIVEIQPEIIKEITKDTVIVPMEQLRLVQPIIEIQEQEPQDQIKSHNEINNSEKVAVKSVIDLERKNKPVVAAVEKSDGNDEVEEDDETVVEEAAAPAVAAVAPATGAANPPAAASPPPTNFFQQQFQNFLNNNPFTNAINSLRPNASSDAAGERPPNLFQNLQTQLQENINNFQSSVNSFFAPAQQSAVVADAEKPAATPSNPLQQLWSNVLSAQSNLQSGISNTFQSVFNRPQDEPKSPNKQSAVETVNVAPSKVKTVIENNKDVVKPVEEEIVEKSS